MRSVRLGFLIAAFWAMSNADSRLAVMHLTGLDYPLLAHWAGRQGAVELVLVIGAKGEVRSVKHVTGDGLLATGASKVLRSWVFTPCEASEGECEYPMSIRFILQGGPIAMSECKTEFHFDVPDRITVVSQYAKAIAD